MARLTADADNIYNEADDLVGVAFDNPTLAKQFAAAPQIIERIVGWRETDWPEGFCRRTAELMVDEVRSAIKAVEQPDEPKPTPPKMTECGFCGALFNPSGSGECPRCWRQAHNED